MSKIKVYVAVNKDELWSSKENLIYYMNFIRKNLDDFKIFELEIDEEMVII